MSSSETSRMAAKLAEVHALIAQQPALARALRKAVAKVEARALKKANLPARFESETVSALSSNPHELAAEFATFRAARRSEPKPVSADSPVAQGVITIGAESYNVSDVTFSLDGKNDLARGLGVGSYLSATILTEAGDALAATLGEGSLNVVMQSGDLRLRGFGMAGAVINARHPRGIAVLFTGPAGSLKVV